MKRVVRLFIFPFTLITHLTGAREYVYPVAWVERYDHHYVYLLHQISLKQLQLLELNTESKAISQALPLSATPAGIKILPDKSGYSYIDQGQIYIKLFSKRSAQKVDIHQPLYHIEIIEWFDAMHCYFSAKYHEQFNLYQLSRSGSLQILVHVPDADCLYPQKIDSTLYYIERSFGKKKYIINSTHYADQSFDGSSADVSRKTILDVDNQPIAFLRMVSHAQGFYVSYPDTIHSSDRELSCLPCAYHQLTYDSLRSEWIAEKLFEFSIPLDFILPDSKERLHESLLPLLPRHTLSGIYFCDCASAKKSGYRNLGGSWYDPEFVKIYYYDPVSKISCLKTDDNDHDLLSPLIIGKNVFYGYSIAGNSKHQPLLPGMWRNEYGQVCYEMPKVVIS